ncbi:nucleoside 2-deoxyribosyltransferase [Tritonibacter mobilis]|uniref:nucleoside 2-deoxyribosyltransferase n=1 Tax=Tritonibacter mobilis TaxID=379347 RepID=UPI001CD93C9D|nr:nucleoside 2-deoxyribosyltransferase [Tritonibacter mobilis]MCA2009826.1 nucleoside 2-deoxyribosyltransferase [Tritonibacter mobilis]
MDPLDLLSEFSNVIIATSVFLGVMYAIFIGNKIFQQMRRNDELNSSTREREFYARYDGNRMMLERQIADLNIRLTKSLESFEKVNHLILDGQKGVLSQPTTATDPNSFLNSLGVSATGIQLDPKLVFVLTPFHPSEKRTYSAIVKALSEFGIRVVRGDEEAVPGDILTHIIRKMLSARLVIANISTRNPNVMYELGIAHALGKDVVMIANSDAELPFDVNSRRILFYSNHTELVDKLQRELARQVFQKS